MLKALANEDRLLILCQLTQGERNVGELETMTGVRQPTLSQQLGILRDEGLVATRRGRQVHLLRAGQPRSDPSDENPVRACTAARS